MVKVNAEVQRPTRAYGLGRWLLAADICPFGGAIYLHFKSSWTRRARKMSLLSPL
jgi:hypothetical protein